ncbi:GNAT family N-acetyltransferase [Rhodocytophaga rosea]|uniref:GNAT family N-acetyltransferase n=1 Tax=Rhodocytophaga rosea TaxID=2704465 RepID=A0A6C0GWH4_9BACT|nr:GNAT family N-acetyltransferase [Rhodocytophaga rosea]QHT71650.1 GNAT family N-acetyltransferase [Rhodocytophaga rosea]
MSKIQFKLISPGDHETIELIAQWYEIQWNIPASVTIKKINAFSTNGLERQVIMLLENSPVATAGIYHHVSLVDKVPRFGMYKHWLALVYTLPAHRNKGLGALVCNYMQDQAKALGIAQLYLFTHTAETLYTRLGWHPIERLELGGKNIAVMKKDLAYL